MNREDALSIARQHAEQQGISAGLDQQVKRNSLAQFAQQQNMLDRLNDQALTPEKRQSLYNDI